MYSKKNKHFADRYTEFLNEISEIEAEVSEADKRYAEHKAKSDAIKAEISVKKDEISKNISTINKLEQYGKGSMALQQVEEKKRENQQIEHAICGLLSEMENISKDLSVAREKANDANKRLKEKRVQLDRYCKANGINN